MEDLFRRLADLAPLSGFPPDELRWLAEHGTLQRYQGGDTIVRRGDPIEHMWIVLSGSVSVTRDTGSGPRPVLEWGPGGITGRLPYSRIGASSVDIRVDVPFEILLIHQEHLDEMVHRCPRFTEHTVHEMIDRARSFKTTELQADKMASLGRLAAGLAHELNNPASATVRGAETLREGLREADSAARVLLAAGLSTAASTLLDEIRTACLERPRQGVLSALERADREAEFEDWLADHGCATHHAASLAETSLAPAALDALARILSPDLLDPAIRWLGANCTTHAVAAEIEGSARRIHDLVAAVKGFTYMDNAGSPDAVELSAGLHDTVRVLAARARDKGASIQLEVDDGLPLVRAAGGALNQVWMNLIDNALSAIDQGGRIEIGAHADGDHVVVRVVDDGPGIPDDVRPRIFEPFFTTKAQGEGTGLGLDIARRLVRRHRGDIEVDSRPGRTEFRVRLRAASPAEPASSSTET